MPGEGRWTILVTAGLPSTEPAVYQIERAVKLGRSSLADILVDHPSISRLHARLEPQYGGIHVTDLGSSNGTRVDGQPIQAGLWSPGQRLTFGDVEFAFAPPSEDAAYGKTSPGGTGRLAGWLRMLGGGGAPADEPRYRLLWRRTGGGDTVGGERALASGATLTIGRQIECDIVLDDPLVSSQHAQLVFRDGGASVADLNSTNGTWIDGARISAAVLLEGQTLTVGPFALSIRFESGDSIIERAVNTIVIPSNRFERLARSIRDRQTVFISYSRQDMEAADRMAAILAEKGFNVTMDRRSLPYGEEWQRELAGLIRNCDTMLFLVTGNSVASKWCRWELELIAKLQKRLFPIIIAPVDLDKLPINLGRVQALPMGGTFSFQEHMPALIGALNTDQAWVKEHSRLQSRAREWLGKGKAEGFLLRGEALKVAIAWSKAVPLTEEVARDVLELIRVSRNARTRRLLTRAAFLPLPIVAAVWIVTQFWPQFEQLPPEQLVVTFCDELRKALEGRRQVWLIDDRCVLQSDITFASGQADLTLEGKVDMDKIATAIESFERIVVRDRTRGGKRIDWVLHIEGHTDKRPISNSRFPSNWELSTARATTAVHYLAEYRHSPSSRRVAAGYGENWPLERGDDEESLRKNRRIEFRITEQPPYKGSHY
jgi:pSer/pThr/pTyr-binding forkhead associated (FHA) protein/outer membrane protein OmpA-like peptidoglycan-associated protein